MKNKTKQKQFHTKQSVNNNCKSRYNFGTYFPRAKSVQPIFAKPQNGKQLARGDPRSTSPRLLYALSS